MDAGGMGPEGYGYWCNLVLSFFKNLAKALSSS